MARLSIFPVLLASWLLCLSLADVEMPYYLDKSVEADVAPDDDKQALLKTRTRIAQGLNQTYGVVMVATSLHFDYAVHTIPIWKAYCEKHGYDFYLQEQSLAPSVRDMWTKPRILMELVTQTKWKYLWLVDPNSLPMDLEKAWPYAIKEHMRKQRYKNDDMKERVVWCPEDCDQDYDDSMLEGSCHGPFVSGCIFHAKETKQILPVLRKWYSKRKTLDDESRGLKLGLVETKTKKGEKFAQMYEKLLWSDVGKEMGRDDSSFLRTFDDAQGESVRNQVVKTLQTHRALGDIINKNGQHRPEL